MEKYLKEDYGVLNLEEDPYFHIEENDSIKESIAKFVREYARELFDCGQGYCQKSAEELVYYNGQLYSVSIVAEIMSAKQNYRDRLYWVEDIKSIEVEEMEMLEPKEKTHLRLDLLNVSKDQFDSIRNVLSELGVEYTVGEDKQTLAYFLI